MGKTLAAAALERKPHLLLISYNITLGLLIRPEVLLLFGSASKHQHSSYLTKELMPITNYMPDRRE
jgi:hypothetical protein